MNISRYALVAVVLFSAAALAGCGNNRGGKLIQIQITPTNRYIATGTKEQFISWAMFGDGTIVNWTSATDWSTSDGSLAKISNSFDTYGLVQSIGSAPSDTIIITGRDIANNIVSTTTLSIVDPLNIYIYPNYPYTKKGGIHDFKTEAKLTTDATTTFQDLTPYTIATLTPYSYVTWTTTDPSVAVVSKNGRVTILAETGYTDIVSVYTFSSASASGTDSRTYTTTITVREDSLESLMLDSDATFSTEVTSLVTTTLISLSTTSVIHFTADAHFTTDPPNTYPVSFTESAKWTSSNATVATISDEPLSKGTCTLSAAGGVRIRATDPITGHTADMVFKVVPSW